MAVLGRHSSVTAPTSGASVEGVEWRVHRHRGAPRSGNGVWGREVRPLFGPGPRNLSGVGQGPRSHTSTRHHDPGRLDTAGRWTLTRGAAGGGGGGALPVAWDLSVSDSHQRSLLLWGGLMPEVCTCTSATPIGMYQTPILGGPFRDRR